MALIAAPLIVPNAAPVTRAAGSNCQGADAKAQPAHPIAHATRSSRVAAARPSRACSAGRRETTAALARKCRVMQAETKATDQPRSRVRACSHTPGPYTALP
jgi:hypothetical protein